MKKNCAGWKFKHSTFARMKGFSLDIDDNINSGYQLLLQGAILDVDSCDRLGWEISDKSKADVLTKSIAIIQITRFLLEISARTASSLPISPLEYFTCAHVFYALTMYIYWFDKPCGVQEKIRLEKGAKRDIGKEELNLHGKH